MNVRPRILLPHSRRARVALAWILVSVLLAGGCAYYNTLYNAKVGFRDAEGQQPRDREGKVTRQTIANYDDVILKCRKLIATWPDSRHVDDAMLLMARSYGRTDRFEQCVGVLDSLEAKYPKTDLLQQAWAVKGHALAAWEHYEPAVEVLEKCVNTYGPRSGVLYDLSISLMRLDRPEDAVHYLQILEKKFPRDERTLDARITVAEILAEKEQYEQSREVYARLNAQRLPESLRYRVWTGFAKVDLALGNDVDALNLITSAQSLTLTPDEEPPLLLMKAKAFEGADSADAAVKTYERVASRFSRGEYGAEAHYRLGVIYEKADSLTLAKKHFDEVPKSYANSDFARDAIKRGNNISKLIKLQESADSDNPEAQAQREFSLAELQLFQFENPEKALEAYQKLLADYPDSEYGPRAAYAVGYIYGVLLADSTRALESYRFLVEHYPDSQQAANAGQFVTALGITPPPRPAVTAPADTAAANAHGGGN